MNVQEHVDTPDEERGRLYWFAMHSGAWLRIRAGERRKAVIAVSVSLALLMLYFRPLCHWAALGLRKNSFLLLVVLFGAGALWLLWQRRTRASKACFLVLALAFFSSPLWGTSAYRYTGDYYHYRVLEASELSSLPLTEHERIQPQSSVHALALDAVTENESPLAPDFVRVNDEYRWTLGIEPAYPIARTLRGVKQIFSLPGTTPAPSFSGANRVDVRFPVGEHLMFSRNSHTATIRSFGVSRFFTYEPAEVVYLPDDNGEWVQVVSLIRWRGFFYPWPEFGGVQVIRQQPDTTLNILRIALLGAGEWIRPEEIAKHPFLRGQNLVSKRVTREIAETFRFQDGFLAPMPGYHDGDVRMPTLQFDINPQPFVSYFRHTNASDGRAGDRASDGNGALYHYFALEPYDVEKQGLNTSLFIRADGTEKPLVYHHLRHGMSLSGVSSMATKVMESKKYYDWGRNRPVEHRPFIKLVDGKTRFFWLTTVVTARLGTEEGKFIAGSIPDVVLTDAQYNTTLWVDAKTPESWVDSLRSEMQGHWANEQ